MRLKAESLDGDALQAVTMTMRNCLLLVQPSSAPAWARLRWTDRRVVPSNPIKVESRCCVDHSHTMHNSNALGWHEKSIAQRSRLCFNDIAEQCSTTVFGALREFLLSQSHTEGLRFGGGREWRDLFRNSISLFFVLITRLCCFVFFGRPVAFPLRLVIAGLCARKMFRRATTRDRPNRKRTQELGAVQWRHRVRIFCALARTGREKIFRAKSWKSKSTENVFRSICLA